MDTFEKIKLALDLGVAVVQAIREGKVETTVWEILPPKYRDQEVLKSIWEKAEADYPAK